MKRWIDIAWRIFWITLGASAVLIGQSVVAARAIPANVADAPALPAPSVPSVAPSASSPTSSPVSPPASSLSRIHPRTLGGAS